MIFETYEMITPAKYSMDEYEHFYYSYGQTIKMNLLVNQVLKEIKEKIPIYFLEIMENIEKGESEIDVYLFASGLKRIETDRKQYKKSIGNMECSLYKIPNDDFFQISTIKTGGLFRISEVNYRFFNHFIVYIWETIYLLEVEIDKNIVPDKFNIIENKFDFKLYDSHEDDMLIQNMPETLTTELNNFHINGYKCPNCNQESIILYKATSGKDFDVSLTINNELNEKYKAQKIFTCPSCKSFYFSLYGGCLSDNRGFNILEINDIDYLCLLRKFNNMSRNNNV